MGSKEIEETGSTVEIEEAEEETEVASEGAEEETEVETEVGSEAVEEETEGAEEEKEQALEREEKEAKFMRRKRKAAHQALEGKAVEHGVSATLLNRELAAGETVQVASYDSEMKTFLQPEDGVLETKGFN